MLILSILCTGEHLDVFSSNSAQNHQKCSLHRASLVSSICLPHRSSPLESEESLFSQLSGKFGLKESPSVLNPNKVILTIDQKSREVRVSLNWPKATVKLRHGQKMKRICSSLSDSVREWAGLQAVRVHHWWAGWKKVGFFHKENQSGPGTSFRRGFSAWWWNSFSHVWKSGKKYADRKITIENYYLVRFIFNNVQIIFCRWMFWLSLEKCQCLCVHTNRRKWKMNVLLLWKMWNACQPSSPFHRM